MLEIIRLENIMAFIRASSTHHSMIDIEVLKSMLDKLITIYSKEQIPDLELREYYDLIKPGSYYNDRTIVIVYKFPIISIDRYNLYRLSIVPNEKQLALIPSFPYIATNEKAFVYIEAECPKYSRILYLCDQKISHQIRTEPDCIQELITNQNLKETCHFTKIMLSVVAIDKLDDQHYIISLPKPEKIQLSCERKEINTLQGSYLATIPINCLLRTREFTIINENDEIKGQPLKLSRIPFNEMNQTTTYTHTGSKMISLDDLHSIQNKFLLETPIQIDKTQPIILYHTTIPLYILISCVSVVIVVLISRKYRCWPYRSENEEKQQTPTTPVYEDVDKDTKRRDELPATFSLKLTK